jgi:putative FmdB family regulatory protein
MPIYEYRCAQCAGEMSCLVRGGDPGPERCEHCGHAAPERIVSAFIVRGTRPPPERALRYGSRDFLERPERFGQAMQALEVRTGMKLPAERVDAAMHRLSQANKSS